MTLQTHPNAPTPIGMYGDDSASDNSHFLMDTTTTSAEWMQFLHGDIPTVGSKRARTEDLGVGSDGHARVRMPMLQTPSVISLQTDEGGSLDLGAAINWLHSNINHLNNLHGQLALERASADQNESRLAALEDTIEQLNKDIEELRNGPAHSPTKKSKIRDAALVVRINV